MIKTKCCEGRRTGKLVKNTLFSSQRPSLPNIYVKTSRKSTRFPVLNLAKDMTVQVAASPCIKRNAGQSKIVGACLACCPKPMSVSTPPVVRPREPCAQQHCPQLQPQLVVPCNPSAGRLPTDLHLKQKAPQDVRLFFVSLYVTTKSTERVSSNGPPGKRVKPHHSVPSRSPNRGCSALIRARACGASRGDSVLQAVLCVFACSTVFTGFLKLRNEVELLMLPQ